MIALLALSAGLSACRKEARSLAEAESLLQQGLEQRAARNTEAAAQSFSDALLAIGRCDPSQTEVVRLKAQIDDNLGAMCWKHGLGDGALGLHLEAVALARQLNDSLLLMKALQNRGRVTASLGRLDEARSFYDESLNLAQSINDSVFINELLMETGHDLYLASGDYAQAIDNASLALANGADPGFCHLVIGLAHYYGSHDSLALVHLHEATLSPKTGVRMPAYQALCQLYRYAGDYPKALECHELFAENMMRNDQEFRSAEVERIKADYELKLQQYQMEAKQRQRNRILYLVLGGLLAYLCVVLLFVTALALTEQITASTLGFSLTETDWSEFVALVDQLHGGFTHRLLAQYPSLNQGDLQICCLTKLGFSNQVIAILMNQQTASYARRKSRIKQEKMNGLHDERSFEEMILAL